MSGRKGKGGKSPGPHDGLFKTFLTHTDTARDFLALHLPAELLQLCDLTTLQLESGSFIEENLRTYFADVLYSLKTTEGEGYIYTGQAYGVQSHAVLHCRHAETPGCRS